MESLRELYRIGRGPSSSHTMGPGLAAARFKNKYADADRFTAVLFGSLSKTGKGHLTDQAIRDAFSNIFLVSFSEICCIILSIETLLVFGCFWVISF